MDIHIHGKPALITHINYTISARHQYQKH